MRENIGGFSKGRLVDPSLLRVRHDALAREMEKRGYQPGSPVENCGCSLIKGNIDILENIVELSSRCEERRALIEQAGRPRVDSA